LGPIWHSGAEKKEQKALIRGGSRELHAETGFDYSVFCKSSMSKTDNPDFA
jgi:hypothetical protein